jgi:amidase
VTDAAILLGVLESRAPDPNDAATNTCRAPQGADYSRFLNANGLRAARIGIPRDFFYDQVIPPGTNVPRGGLSPEQRTLMSEAIAVLRQQGAVIVDPAVIPSIVSAEAAGNFLRWPTCAGLENARDSNADCSTVRKYGMKRDFNNWLASLGAAAPIRTLTELRQWNLAHQRAGAIKYGQAQLDSSDEMDVEADRSRYESDKAREWLLSATNGIDAVMKREKLDALLFPGTTGAEFAARPGYPTVIVPFGFVPNAPMPPFPPNFNAKPAPYGVSFTGMACSEPRLIELAYAFEQATKRRVPPVLAP